MIYPVQSTLEALSIDELRQLIREHEHKYYVQNQPELPDYVFDQLMAKLVEIEAESTGPVPPDSPTQRVGSSITDNQTGTRIRHHIPMLSLENTYKPEDLLDFDKGIIITSGSVRDFFGGLFKLNRINDLENIVVSIKKKYLDRFYLEINSINELKGVGKNLQDHLMFRPVYKVKNLKSLNRKINSIFGNLMIGLEYIFNQSGPMTMGASQVCGFAKSDSSRETPNLQFHVQPISTDILGASKLHDFDGITPTVANIRPSSRGEISIVSNDLSLIHI